MLGIPTTVVYTASKTTETLAKQLTSIQSVSLVNIIAEKKSHKQNQLQNQILHSKEKKNRINLINKSDTRIVSELLFDDCTSTNLTIEINHMLTQHNTEQNNIHKNNTENNTENRSETSTTKNNAHHDNQIIAVSNLPSVHSTNAGVVDASDAMLSEMFPILYNDNDGNNTNPSLLRPSYLAANAVMQVCNLSNHSNHSNNINNNNNTTNNHKSAHTTTTDSTINHNQTKTSLRQFSSLFNTTLAINHTNNTTKTTLRQFSSMPNRGPKRKYTFRYASRGSIQSFLIGTIALMTGVAFTVVIGGTVIGIGLLGAVGVALAVLFRKLSGKPMGGGEQLWQYAKQAQRRKQEQQQQGGQPGSAKDRNSYSEETDLLIPVLSEIIHNSPSIKNNFRNTKTKGSQQHICIGNRLTSHSMQTRKQLSCEYELLGSVGNKVVGKVIVTGLQKEEKGFSSIVNPVMEEISSVRVVTSQGKQFDLSVPLHLKKVVEEKSTFEGFSEKVNEKFGSSFGNGNGGKERGRRKGGANRKGSNKQTIDLDQNDFKVKK